jgi:putative endonuclease
LKAELILEQAPQDERPGYVYLIATCDGGAPRSYVGWSYDVQARLSAHNSGRGAKATKGRQWRLIHCEEHASKQVAMSAEYYLKRDRTRRRRLLARAR